ncbi:hypothetical protein LZL87_009472 [Fusarium oxysporum]|nr:hypothetical protein LZL87_009472 [Fusarium oxysporum]
MLPVSIHDGQAISITEGALKKAHKSNVQDNGPPPNAPTGPAADRGRPQNAPTGAYQSYRTEGHEAMSFGPSPISSPEHEKDVKKQDQCACIHGGSFELEIEDMPHFEPDKWRVYGAHLETLRLRVNSIRVLTGLQFVAQESESQKWGFCNGDHTAELDLQSKQITTAGIEFFLDSNGRNDVSEDTVVGAVQLIEVQNHGQNPRRKGYKIPRHVIHISYKYIWFGS